MASTTTDTTSKVTLEGSLNSSDFSEFREEFDANPSYRLMQNAVALHDVNDIALDRSIVTAANHTYSDMLDDWTVTDQGRTGRCWMFAGLNLFRADSKNVLNVKQTEFSQNYMMFWDKIERANFILEAIIDAPTHAYALAPMIDLPEGTVAGALKRLEELELTASTARIVDGRARRVFRITAKGRKALEAAEKA